MDVIGESVDSRIIERRFDLSVDGEKVPGIHWLPETASSPHPTVLIGHGGGQHKRAPGVLALASKLVSERGYGVVALDAPGHGDRMTDEQRQARAERLEGRPAGRPTPVPQAVARAMARAAPRAVAEWKALLDELGRTPQYAGGPFGYWGVSMGTALGMPLVASEPRIAAAVLGLGALAEGSQVRRADAAGITVPLLFLLQWDDELMTRDAGIALWDAFGSQEKTMHVNLGPHAGIPQFERDSSVAFFRRHLQS